MSAPVITGQDLINVNSGRSPGTSPPPKAPPMDKIADLLALAERVEQATEPDRGLDCLIENALDLAKFDRDPCVGYGDAEYSRRTPKPYTTSIDAAMTLVPGGWNFETGKWHNRGNATVQAPGYNEDTFSGISEYCDAATPAAALAAASLRVRAALLTQGVE